MSLSKKQLGYLFAKKAGKLPGQANGMQTSPSMPKLTSPTSSPNLGLPTIPALPAPKLSIPVKKDNFNRVKKFFKTKF